MRYTPNGQAVTNFSIATNYKYTTAEGERREETEWFRVSAWGRLAETCNQYLGKGRKVYVEGRLKSRTFEGRDGQTRVSLEISATDVRFIDTPGGRMDDFPSGAEGAMGEGAPESTTEIDDLPF